MTREGTMLSTGLALGGGEFPRSVEASAMLFLS